ncbi:hypothetical protein [Roseovarius ramblicola]|uniref:Uncharacterized protein n=1 Tax=Roseovarius ramblicola TaxID=2022336 RepID=A0ABV5HZ19_9RHOB
MSNVEIVICVVVVSVSVLLIIYMLHIAKSSGRVRLHDPERVRRFVESAPYDRLKDVLDDYER